MKIKIQRVKSKDVLGRQYWVIPVTTPEPHVVSRLQEGRHHWVFFKDDDYTVLAETEIDVDLEYNAPGPPKGTITVGRVR